MSEVVLFSGPETFDQLDVRMSAIRIPEVLAALKEAEYIFDIHQIKFIPLANFLTYEERFFQRDDDFKKIVLSIVQLGLFKRYARFRQEPPLILGYVDKTSILEVVTGYKSFETWLLDTPWVQRQKSNVFELNFHVGSQLPVLSKGYSQAPLSLFSLQPKPASVAYGEMMHGQSDLETLLQELLDRHGIYRYVTVGIATQTRDQLSDPLLRESLEIMDCVELDPLLTWIQQPPRVVSLASVH